MEEIVWSYGEKPEKSLKNMQAQAQQQAMMADAAKQQDLNKKPEEGSVMAELGG